MSSVARSPDAGHWRGRRVLLTGHTGFKGAWLAFWLCEMGAEVHGLAIDVPTDPALYGQSGLASRLASDVRLDIHEHARLVAHVAQVTPRMYSTWRPSRWCGRPMRGRWRPSRPT